MDQPKIERLLRLMKMLSGPVDHTVDELAEILGMTPRTVYRYFDTFKSAGFSLQHKYGNVYKLDGVPEEAPNFEKLLYFSEEEAYLINSLIDRLSPTNSLKKGLKDKLAIIYDSTNIEDFVDRRSNAAHVENLRKAAEEKKQVILHDYESASSDSVRDRRIEPFGFTTDFIEVWGYDLEAQKNKVFKITRIGEVEILDKPWRWETSHRKMGRDLFRMSGYANAHVRLQLSVRAKNLLIEEYPQAEKAIVRDGNVWILDTVVNDFAGITRFYAGLMHEIKVLEGEAFLEYVREYLKRFVNKI